MRIALFSDIHGNVHALEAVLADLRRQAPDAAYCLGDLVGYGASPNEVCAQVAAMDVSVVMGNYDDGVGFDRDDCGCAYRDGDERLRGQRSLMWTRATTTPAHKEYLRSCLPSIRLEASRVRTLLVHGSPRRMNEYLFEERPLSSFERLAAEADADLIAFGHTHKPYVKDARGVRFVNIGSVGKPKDGDWRACYALVDLSSHGLATVTFRRVAYDVAAAAAAIRAAGLPEQFARDIETGGAKPAA